jgi:hypothetical protein
LCGLGWGTLKASGIIEGGNEFGFTFEVVTSQRVLNSVNQGRSYYTIDHQTHVSETDVSTLKGTGISMTPKIEAYFRLK